MAQRGTLPEMHTTLIGSPVPQDIRHLTDETLLHGSAIKIHQSRNAAHVSSRRQSPPLEKKAHSKELNVLLPGLSTPELKRVRKGAIEAGTCRHGVRISALPQGCFHVGVIVRRFTVRIRKRNNRS